ncbi:hypothetical protein FQN54_009070 [Arachnomyces sp. PD_36]|nr:hypothetical protein FQN54_009070 [Arachnomyces sp. PD_36]
MARNGNMKPIGVETGEWSCHPAVITKIRLNLTAGIQPPQGCASAEFISNAKGTVETIHVRSRKGSPTSTGNLAMDRRCYNHVAVNMRVQKRTILCSIDAISPAVTAPAVANLETAAMAQPTVGMDASRTAMRRLNVENSRIQRTKSALSMCVVASSVFAALLASSVAMAARAIVEHQTFPAGKATGPFVTG